MNRLGSSGETYIRHRQNTNRPSADKTVTFGKFRKDSSVVLRRKVDTVPFNNVVVSGQSVLDFADKFDQLVDVLCVSAKEGVTEGRQKRYLALREWFETQIISFADVLKFAQTEIETCGCQETLQTLFQPERIEGVINSESVILRMMRTRALVDSCRAKAELDMA